MLNPQIIPATEKNRLDLNKDKPRIYVICKTGFAMYIARIRVEIEQIYKEIFNTSFIVFKIDLSII